MTTSDAAGFYFELLFKGERTAFREASGISKGLSVEDIAEGGENHFKYKLPTITSQNLTIKKGLTPITSALAAWCNNSIAGVFEGKIETNDISLSLLDAEGKVLMKWAFYNAYPVKFDFSNPKNMGNELLIESLELAYTYLETSAI